MARGGFRRGAYGGSSRNGDGRGPTSVPSSKRNILLGIDEPTGFTLADEARSTAHGTDTWSKDSRLRSRPVSFVSAGTIDPLKQLEEQLQRKAAEALRQFDTTPTCDDGTRDVSTQGGLNRPGQLTHPDQEATEGPSSTDVEAEVIEAVGELTLKEDSSMEAESSGELAEATTSGKHVQAATQEAAGTISARVMDEDPQPVIATSPETQRPPSPPLFFMDTTGDPSYREHETHNTRFIETIADPETDSSEEVILFKGRHQKPKQQQASTDKLRKQSSRMIQSSQVEGKPDRDAQNVTDTNDGQPANTYAPSAAREHSTRALTRKEKKRDKNEKKKNKKNRKAKTGKPSAVKADSDADVDAELIADYIANMREFEEDDDFLSNKGHLRRDIGGSDLDIEPSTLKKIVFVAAEDTQSESDLEPDTDIDPTKTSTNGLADPVLQQPALEDAEFNVDELLMQTSAKPVDSDAFLEPKLSDDSDDSEEEEEEEANDGRDVFDYMDWGDALPAKRSRKSKGKIPNFNISDSEIEAKLQAAFKTDRLKKAEKKKERERLRAQGLLGHKVKPDDPRVKYLDGMSLDQIAEELRGFLLGNQTSITLSPMDHHARKVIHELANKFNIKSKSTGAGDQRRPTLIRTLRTFRFSQDAFDQAIARVGRKYFPRRDRTKNGPVNGANRDRGGHAAITYRDGEVVGGSAPELGEENRGRAMLEKMGWSSGMGLGTLTNKGILQPVEQKVKRGKAGLG